MRDDKLQANTWARNRSPNALENSGPAPFDYKQYAYSLGGPMPVGALKDKLFFFAAQEWVNFLPIQTQHRHGADREDAHRRLQRAARPEQRFFTGARIDHRSARPASRSRATSSRRTG